MLELELSYGTVRYLDSAVPGSAAEGPERLQETLLLVHGFPLDHTLWRAQFEPLARSFRILVPDLAGFGQSTRTRAISSLKGLADELAELLDRLGVDRVNFCGLSLGGYIGWQFWKHHSARLSRLIACNTRAAADSPTMARTRRITAESVRVEGVSKLVEGMLGRLFATENAVLLPNEVRLIRDSMYRAQPESVAQALEAMGAREDAMEWLAHINQPTLFIAGANDEVTPAQEMRENAARVPSAQFVEIAQAGHLSPLENPQAFNQAVEQFLKSTSGS